MADGLGALEWSVRERESTVLIEASHDGRPIVWKALRPSADRMARARFAREYAVLRSIRHPNVVRTLTPEGSFDGAFAMPRLEGTTLREWLARHRAMPSEIALHVGRGMLHGLDVLHRVGVVHRDVKPENVFYGREPGESVSAARAIIIDLGVAHAVGVPLTAEGMIVGTLRYLAPEQIDGGRIAAPTDLYAVGLCLFELLTGTSFHERSLRRTWDLERRLGGLDGARRRNMATCEPLLRTALRRDPAQRFQSAAQMLAALDAASEGRTR